MQSISSFTIFVEGREENITYRPEQEVKIFEDGKVIFEFG
jgi:hypothetical protein